MHDLPASLRLSSPFPFVGRISELQRLEAVMPRADGEGRRVALVAGESGSGKSRLVREFARAEARDGALVLYGASDAVVSTPYGPFTQALEHLSRAIDPEELQAALGTAGGELSRLLPELSAGSGQSPLRVNADPDTERHRLHTAVTGLLNRVAGGRPVILLLEDTQWADTPTVLLLRHLARTAAGPLLILATFRESEVNVPGPLAQTLADLRRSDDGLRLSLTGLSGDEVTEFIERAGTGLGTGDGRELASAISDLTNGNPFLVCELWRALLETEVVQVADGIIRLSRPLATLVAPAGVREVVTDRLARLSSVTGTVLDLAATAGREFELETIRRGTDLAQGELLLAVDQAIRTGIIEQLPGRKLAYRFTHELVRRAAYDRLAGARKAQLHLSVGESIEAAGEGSARALADLAYHFTAAAPLGEPRRAIEYDILAARAAIDALAFDQAGELLRTALELGVDEPSQRAELLVELGSAWQRAGRESDALDALRSAADLARGLRDAELLARAAIGFEAACWAPMIIDQGAVELLEEAAATLGPQSSALRIGLLGGLARALGLRGEQIRAASVRRTAVDLARRLHERSALATVLMRSYWSRGVSWAEIQQMLAEAKQLGEELGDTEIRVEAMAWRVPSFVAVGDMDSARRELSGLREAAETTGQPLFMHVAEQFGSAIALADGDLLMAETMARRSYDAGQLLTGRDSSGTYGIQMFSLRREQGRLAELAPVIRVLTASDREHGPWRPGLVSLLVEIGMEAEARQALAQICSRGLGRFRESLWLASLTFIADACAALGDKAAAELAYPELDQLKETNVIVGQLVACYGSVERYRGMLAATLGEWNLAERHFETALAQNRQMNMATWVAHTEYEYARLLRARGDSDPQHTGELLADASQLARQHRLQSLQRRVEALGTPAVSILSPDQLTEREAQILRLVAQGLTNREIGAELFISGHTAAKHISNILSKTGCANRTEATTYAHEHGLVDKPKRG